MNTLVALLLLSPLFAQTAPAAPAWDWTQLFSGTNIIIVLLAVFLFKDQLAALFNRNKTPVQTQPPAQPPATQPPTTQPPATPAEPARPVIDALITQLLPLAIPLIQKVIADLVKDQVKEAIAAERATLTATPAPPAK